MKLIALSGLPRSGKDSVAVYLCRMYGFECMSFAAPLKRAAAVLLDRTVQEMEGINFNREAILPEWGFSTRHFLQYLGTEVVRHFDPDFWVKHMQHRLLGKQQQINVRGRAYAGDKIVISDCRFINEAKMIKDLGGFIVEVIRPSSVKSNHLSDAGVPCDAQVNNDGTLPDLYAQIELLALRHGWVDWKPLDKSIQD